MEFPVITVRVELAFGADPGGDHTRWIWTDVSSDLLAQSIQIQQGRQDEMSQVQPSSMTLRLDNAEGRYTPESPRSPFFPNVRLGTPIRLWVDLPAEIGADRQPRFVGFVSEWAPTWPHGDLSNIDTGYPGESEVQLTASGVLRRLTQGATLLKSPLRRGMLSPGLPTPIEYWPAEDGHNATEIASAVGGIPGRILDQVKMADYDGFFASSPLPTFDDPGGVIFSVRQDYNSGDGIRVTFAIHIPQISQDAIFALFRMTGGVYNGALVVDKQGSLKLRFSSANDVTLFDSPNVTFEMLGKKILMWLSLRGIKGGFRYEMGTIEQGTGKVLAYGEDVASLVLTLGKIRNFRLAGPGLYPFPGTSFGHVAIYATEDVDPYKHGALLVGNDGEPAGERMVRLAREEKLPLTVTGNPSETPPMGPQSIATLLTLIRECADADGGLLSEARALPGLSYRSHVSLYGQSPRLRLDGSSRLGDIVNPFSPILDDQAVRNDVTVERRGGSYTTVTDQTDIARRGRYDDRITLNVQRDDQLPAIAAWRLLAGTWPGMRYPSVSPALTGSPELIAPWTRTNLGDRVDVTGLPPQHPAGTVSLLVQGYTETVHPQRWDVQLNTSPAGPWLPAQVAASPKTAGEDQPNRADTEGALLADAISSIDRLLTVVTTAGPPWISTDSHPADFPFLVTIGGEIVRVVSISDAQSPQTFVVERGINGGSLRHPSGRSVSLAALAYIAR